MGRAVLIAAICIGLVGCQVSTAPTALTRLDRAHAVAMMRAPWNGQYTLYLLPSDRKGKPTEVQTAHLKRNEPLGFRQRQSGPVAVAGELEVPLGSGQYEWVMRADPGQPNWLVTAAVVVLVVGVTAGVLAILFQISLDHALKHAFSGAHYGY